jgi:hypothetical protein
MQASIKIAVGISAISAVRQKSAQRPGSPPESPKMNHHLERHHGGDGREGVRALAEQGDDRQGHKREQELNQSLAAQAYHTPGKSALRSEG